VLLSPPDGFMTNSSLATPDDGHTAHIWQPATESWHLLEPDIMFLERQAFGDKAFEAKHLKTELTDPTHVVALLRDGGTSRVMGFTYAIPVTEVEPHRAPAAANTAYIADTVLEEGLRGRRLVGVLMASLEDELRRRGFKFLERHAAVAHGYAAKISKHYSTRIEAQRRPNESEWGPQVFFRIRL
jgi:hypothetical protein